MFEQQARDNAGVREQHLALEFCLCHEIFFHWFQLRNILPERSSEARDFKADPSTHHPLAEDYAWGPVRSG